MYKEDLAKIRATGPLVHCITNAVAMEFNANALLAVGASPIMSSFAEEMVEIVRISSALCINIGTLDRSQIEAMKIAAAAAQAFGVPWVLDPVGVGASSIRLQTAQMLISHYHPQVIRGNASEILTLAGKTVKSRGVDSLYRTEANEAGEREAGAQATEANEAGEKEAGAQATEANEAGERAAGARETEAQTEEANRAEANGAGERANGADSLCEADERAVAEFAGRSGAVVSVSGPVDVITDGIRTVRLEGGDPIMSRVTAMGCTATALTAAFLAVNENAFDAAANAMALMSAAGEAASKEAKAIQATQGATQTTQAAQNARTGIQGTGTFKISFLDALCRK